METWMNEERTKRKTIRNWRDCHWRSIEKKSSFPYSNFTQMNTQEPRIVPFEFCVSIPFTWYIRNISKLSLVWRPMAQQTPHPQKWKVIYKQYSRKPINQCQKVSPGFPDMIEWSSSSVLFSTCTRYKQHNTLSFCVRLCGVPKMDERNIKK